MLINAGDELNPILASLCTDALISIGDGDSDWKLSFDEFANCLDPSKFGLKIINFYLNRDPRYKRDSSSHFRQHLISILIKSCSARGRLDLFPKELQNKTTKPN